MRQILMSKPGEFSYKKSTDQWRGAAVKMLANVIKSADSEDSDEHEVVVSNKPAKLKR